MSVVLNSDIKPMSLALRPAQAQILVPTQQIGVSAIAPYFIDVFISIMLIMMLLMPLMLIPLMMFKSFGGLLGGVLK